MPTDAEVKALVSAIERGLGSGYEVRHLNPLTYGWTVYRNEDECGGMAYLGKWCHIYGMATAGADDQAFVKLVVMGAIANVSNP